MIFLRILFFYFICLDNITHSKNIYSVTVTIMLNEIRIEWHLRNFGILFSENIMFYIVMATNQHCNLSSHKIQRWKVIIIYRNYCTK